MQESVANIVVPDLAAKGKKKLKINRKDNGPCVIPCFVSDLPAAIPQWQEKEKLRVVLRRQYHAAPQASVSVLLYQ